MLKKDKTIGALLFPNEFEKLRELAPGDNKPYKDTYFRSNIDFGTYLEQTQIIINQYKNKIECLERFRRELSQRFDKPLSQEEKRNWRKIT